MSEKFPSQRSPKRPSNRPSPFSIRLSSQERSELEKRADAAGLSLGGYCKFALMGQPPPRRSRRPRADAQELARVLGELGRVGNNLNQIARGLNTESIIDLPRLDEALQSVQSMRAMVMTALGYRDDSDTQKPDDAP